MSRKDREDWQALLDADPALRAAWDGFRGTLDRVTGPLTPPHERDLAELRAAALRVRAEAGEDQARH